MNSKALDNLFMAHGEHLDNVIQIINETTTPEKSLLMMRLFIVSLVAFWEAFHEDLCQEVLDQISNRSKKKSNGKKTNLHNPSPNYIDKLYKHVLGIDDITTNAWLSEEFREKINQMVNLRHKIAHGKWEKEPSAKDCEDYLAAVLYLANLTERAVGARYQMFRYSQ